MHTGQVAMQTCFVQHTGRHAAPRCPLPIDDDWCLLPIMFQLCSGLQPCDYIVQTASCTAITLSMCAGQEPHCNEHGHTAAMLVQFAGHMKSFIPFMRNACQSTRAVQTFMSMLICSLRSEQAYHS